MSLARASVSVSEMQSLDATISDILQAIDENLEDVASFVENEAQTTADFADKTGTLRKRIKKKKSKFEEGGWIVVARAPHAHLVEYGHVMIAWGRVTGKRVPPHPFMRPALERGIAYAVAKFRGSKL